MEHMEDYYSISEALDGMKDAVFEFPLGALIIGAGYNSFAEEFDVSKYQKRDSTFPDRLQKIRQQKLYPAILDFQHRLTLYAYSFNPFILHVWNEKSKQFTCVKKELI